MRIYIRDVDKPDEYLQVVNTHTSEDIFIPLPGESIFIDYVVLRREWITMEPGQEKVTIWVEPKSKDKVELVFRKAITGFFKKTGGETIQIITIPRRDLGMVPRIGEEIELLGKNYKIREIKMTGDFLKPEKIGFSVVCV